MHMKLSVITKFYDAQNIQKYIQSYAHFINIQSFFIGLHARRIFFFLYTETTQKINEFLIKNI
jgi:hypothetical protein